jgi:hypothetical protein
VVRTLLRNAVRVKLPKAIEVAMHDFFDMRLRGLLYLYRGLRAHPFVVLTESTGEAQLYNPRSRRVGKIDDWCAISAPAAIFIGFKMCLQLQCILSLMLCSQKCDFANMVSVYRCELAR